MASEDEQQMQVNFQKVDVRGLVMMLLMLFIAVFVMKTSYNAVVPNITKQGSLKLGSINMSQALALMVLTGMVCCQK